MEQETKITPILKIPSSRLLLLAHTAQNLNGTFFFLFLKKIDQKRTITLQTFIKAKTKRKKNILTEQIKYANIKEKKERL